jgi:hypothetical protein
LSWDISFAEIKNEEIEELIKSSKYRKYKEYTPESELDEMKTTKDELKGQLYNLDISYNELVANDISGDTIKNRLFPSCTTIHR